MPMAGQSSTPGGLGVSGLGREEKIELTGYYNYDNYDDRGVTYLCSGSSSH
jgi:hypothetical protein